MRIARLALPLSTAWRVGMISQGFEGMHKKKLWRSLPVLLVSLLASFGPSRGAAVDLNFTGFGTLGFARSDQDFKYLRYIDDRGTFKTDSILGVQAEAQFNPQWSATVQAVASAPRTRDEGYEAKIRWAFIGFRPSNDWLLRAGRVRPPIFINTQNAEVGATFDQARLPAEVYSISPVYDFDGAAVTKTWSLSSAEINLDAYWGKADLKYRFHSQNEPLQPYFAERVTVKGLIVSHTAGALFVRGGVHYATAQSREPQQFPESYAPMVIPGPAPIGGSLYVPTGFTPEFDITVLTLGADWRSGDWRVTTEYAQRIVPDLNIAFSSKSAYVTLARRLHRWTPYATYARLLSDSKVRDVYKGITGTPVPLAVQGPPSFIPANLHRLQADTISIYDQYSTMLGTSYSFSATSKLKLEWMRTKIGLASSLTDGDANGKSFNVFSVSYSAAF
jgi:hypothetical protein